MPGWRNL
jgi:putative transposase